MFSESNRDKKLSAEKKNPSLDNVGKKAQKISGDLTEAANSAGQTVRQFIDNTTSGVTEAKDAVTDHIKEKPLQSSFIALAAGFFLGVLFRR